MCDTEALILAVEKYPCLWDINHDEYHNYVVKDLAWKEIYKELHEDWDNATKSQKKLFSSEYKKKWTNARDYYRKDLLKRSKAGSAAKRMKKYVYADLLKFLEPVLTKKTTEFETINCESISIDDEEEQLQDDDEYEDRQYHEDKHETVYYEKPTKRKTRRETSPSVSTSRRVKQASVITNQYDDDDSMFLLSFRGDMKQMDAEQKIDFKIGLLNLVRSVRHTDDS